MTDDASPGFRVPPGADAEERALLGALRASEARAAEVAERIAADGLVVDGSAGQPRPHPLLAVERTLRAEQVDLHRKVAFHRQQRRYR